MTTPHIRSPRTTMLVVLLIASFSFLDLSALSSFAQCEVRKVTASDTHGHDFFGWAVSMSGAYLLVGAHRTDGACPQDLACNSGSVYVFRRDGLVWVEAAELTAADADAGDLFGGSVSISGTSAVIGAHFNDDACPSEPNCNSGSVYVFRRIDNSTPSDPSDDIWIEEAKLTASDAERFDLLGFAVAVSGNVVVVGAHGDDDEFVGSGAAYIFKREDAAWVEEQKLTASDAVGFGVAVAIDSGTIVVGAPNSALSTEGSGAAYIFRYDGVAWVEETRLAAPNGAFHFGGSAAIEGDVIVVGAKLAVGDSIDPVTGSGAAYVYRREGPTWVYETRILPSDPGLGDNFGGSISLSDNRIVIGVEYDNIADAGHAGSAYLFAPVDGGWTELGKWTASDFGVNDRFGSSVALWGEYAAVGAIWDDDVGGNAGSVYIYKVEGGPDCNLNGVNDACETDCNENGMPDDCDIATGHSQDCTGDGVPDECEPDCNLNQEADSCDILDGTSRDDDGNGVPDECEVLVPTVSRWGLTVTALGLLVAGTVCARRVPELTAPEKPDLRDPNRVRASKLGRANPPVPVK